MWVSYLPQNCTHSSEEVRANLWDGAPSMEVGLAGSCRNISSSESVAQFPVTNGMQKLRENGIVYFLLCLFSA